MLNIKNIRRRTQMTQKDFSNIYNIPINTIRQWEQGIASPPYYVLVLLNKALESDGYFKTEENTEIQ